MVRTCVVSSIKPRGGGWISGIATVLTVGVITAGCGQSPSGTAGTPTATQADITSVRVSQADVGADWPFDGIAGGVVYCDPNHPSKALFHVTDTTSEASQYTDQIWALNGDEAYPLPPQDVWDGDVSVLAKRAPQDCR
jgi:hypothetical protein